MEIDLDVRLLLYVAELPGESIPWDEVGEDDISALFTLCDTLPEVAGGAGEGMKILPGSMPQELGEYARVFQGTREQSRRARRGSGDACRGDFAREMHRILSGRARGCRAAAGGGYRREWPIRRPDRGGHGGRVEGGGGRRVGGWWRDEVRRGAGEGRTGPWR